MNLIEGEIVEIYSEDGTSMAKVRVAGVFLRVPVALIPDAKVGDRVLIESGVAIAKVESEQTKEP